MRTSDEMLSRIESPERKARRGERKRGEAKRDLHWNDPEDQSWWLRATGTASEPD